MKVPACLSKVDRGEAKKKSINHTKGKGEGIGSGGENKRGGSGGSTMWERCTW